MYRKSRQSGLSLMELLVAMAIILILISTLIGVGSYVKTRANLDLTEGMLETLCTALEQYYDDFSEFPFDTPDTNTNGFFGDDYAEVDLLTGIDPTGTGILSPPALPLHSSADTGPDTISSASSVALFYFLDHDPSSRLTVEAVPNALVTNKDDTGINIQITLNTVPLQIVDLPRYIDPWGMSIRYEYLTGAAFPVLTSAGPDQIFDTPDDITSQ